MKPIQDEELEMLREVILLPILLTVLERDKIAIKDSKVKFQQPYIKTIDKAMEKVSKDISLIRQKMYKAGIKVTKENRSELDIRCDFLCRGYSDTFVMLWGFVKAEIEVRMNKYLTGDN